jgi:hypothetical protein
MTDGQSETITAKEECLAFFAFVDVYAEGHPDKLEEMERQAYGELRELFAGCSPFFTDEELWRRAEDWAFDRLLDEVRDLWDRNHSHALQAYGMLLWRRIAERPVRRDAGPLEFTRVAHLTAAPRRHSGDPMYETQEEPRRSERTPAECRPLETIVRDNVLLALGRPAGLQRAQARHMWNDYYRVNVFVGVDAASCKVAHSFFLKADGGGRILMSSPAITREYQLDERPPATKQGAGPSAN